MKIPFEIIVRLIQALPSLTPAITQIAADVRALLDDDADVETLDAALAAAQARSDALHAAVQSEPG